MNPSTTAASLTTQPTYRNFLQGLANSGNSQAGALLQVVGDNFDINDTFDQAGQNIGYKNASGTFDTYTKPQLYNANTYLTDAYKNSANVQGASTTNNTSATNTNYNPAQLSQFNQAESTINNGLGRIDNQLNIARGNVNGQYDNQARDLQTQRDNANSNYNTSSTQNSQQLRTNKNTISDQASNGLRGLLRTLGAYGAVGSDMSVAGQAVANQASQQRSGAGQNFAENQSGLDTNWGNYVSQFDSNKKGLEDWKQNQLNSVESQGLTNRQSLLTKLADIKNQRTALLGGNGAVAAQPYLDQANALSGQIDNLGTQVQGYTGTAPTYEAKPLSSYDAGTGTAGVMANQGAGVGLNTPYLSLLLGKDKQKQPFLG